MPHFKHCQFHSLNTFGGLNSSQDVSLKKIVVVKNILIILGDNGW